MDANGMVDESKLPPTMGVADSTGAVVGYVETRHYGTGLYPEPVLGPDGNLIGHIGENGYWALGEPEPYIKDAYTVIEEYGPDGELTRHEIIRPEPPAQGEEGPVGNTE